MLLWLQKRLSKKAILLSKLVGFTTCMHMLIFLCGIIIYHFRSETKLIINVAQRLHNNDATIVVLPFQKQVKQAMTMVKKTSQPKRVAKKSPTTLVQKKPKVVQKVEPKKTIKKVADKPKKLESKKTAKPLVTAKKDTSKKISPNVQTKKETSSQKVVAKKQELPALKMAQAQAEQKDDSVVYIGRHDAQVLKIHEQIVQEIHKHWRPPVGIAHTCMCELKVSVNGIGSVSHVAIEKPSGVLVYDISARSAVLAMKLPQWTWGKELMIAFNQ